MNVVLDPQQAVPFLNRAAYCIGTGKMALALREDYQQHLSVTQKEIGFEYIRGHGLFCEEMGIYHVHKVDGQDVVTYNFTYLDRVFDRYLRQGIKPFIELGFMPPPIASGEQTIFFWKGNVTPPRDAAAWQALVESTLRHLISRYGIEQVAAWPIEVWNEPNISPFWSGTMQDYFDLYEATAASVKRVSPRLQVGGPAICGVDTEHWLVSFFAYCEEKNLPLDFVARHCYTAGSPTRNGQYFYHDMMPPTRMIDELQETREIMARYGTVKDLPLYITEFNSSYNSRCPVHDTAFNAAYMARILSQAGEYAQGYSYWTFSDVFEEEGVPLSEFHGGFGLISGSGIKKPTFYTFAFFKQLGDTLLYRDENLLVTRRADGSYAIVAWNYQDLIGQAQSAFKPYTLTLPAFCARAVAARQTVGQGVCDPLQAWSDLGKPLTLTAAQHAVLTHAAEPLYTTQVLCEADGQYILTLDLQPNQLCLVEILPAPDCTAQLAGFDASQFYGLK